LPTTYKNNAKISLKSKFRARLLSGLSCGQSRSPARTVFIRDVIWESKKGLGQSSPIWVIFQTPYLFFQGQKQYI